MKALIIGDAHWCQYCSIVNQRGLKFSVRLENLIKTINWVERLAEELKVDIIIYLGDYFDRQDLNCEEITAMGDIKWSNIPHVFIVGNHESNVSDLSFSSTKLLEAHGGRVISQPTTEFITPNCSFTYIPYITTNSTLNVTDYIEGNAETKIVFSHQDLAGLTYGKYVSKAGFNIPNIVDNNITMFNGHLHNGGMIGDNIFLVGNITGQNFNEDAEIYSHNAMLLTIENDKIKSVDTYENPNALNFYKLRIMKESDLNKLYKIKDNSVLSVIYKYDLRDRLTDAISNSDKVVAVKYNIVYDNNNEEIEDPTELLLGDYISQFMSCARENIENSPILDYELSLLGV